VRQPAHGNEERRMTETIRSNSLALRHYRLPRRLLVAALIASGLVFAPVAGALTTEEIPPPEQKKPMGPGGPSGRSKPPSAPTPQQAVHVGKIQLNRRTPVSSTVNVHDKVLDQCDIETMLPQLIAERNADVTLVDVAKGTRLELKILDIHAPNGGVFSGPKWIEVEGRLYSGKTLQGDFMARQTSMASATACGMLQKVMLVIADDVAGWLRHPSRGAKLGRVR
jgi:hypothetical protein